MRLFIAAELPGEMTDALAETSAELRAHVRGRYVAPDSFHVTLAFLGNVEAARVNAAADALGEGCRRYEPFDLSLGELGSFGRRKKATLWQGFNNAGALSDLASSIRASLQARGIAFDDKPFRPHVTLMRAADLTTGALPAPATASGRVDAITLFRSDLSGERPVYEPVHSVSLRREHMNEEDPMSSEKTEFSLRAIIDAIDCASVDSQWFANTRTGEVDVYTDPLFTGEEYDEDAFEGEEWLSLPDQFDRDDWRMMRDFAYALGGKAEDELLDAIHGRRAFRNFRNAVERAGLLQSWYAYKDGRLCELAVDWLKSNDCSWTDDRHENQKRDWRDLLPDALRNPLRLSVLGCDLSVCQCASVPAGLLDEGFCCITRTDEEISVVCETEKAPADATAREDGWRAFKVCGPLDLGLVGILARISSALADADVPLFAVSTYDTDYVLVKGEDLAAASAALRESGCVVDGA